MQFDLTPYHAKYFAYELTKRSASDSVQKLASTLVDAQVDLNPHQVEAALFAFQSPLSKGAILADEVGLGKTIEAGLVISQKWAERKRKMLIITPANLRKQWSQELQDKFFLSSIILESKSFNEITKTGNFNPFDNSSIVICSYQFARSKEAYIKFIQWDLVVIDEAHRLRNIYKPGNKIARAIKDAVENAPKILLTATPLQNSLLELYGLVSIIDDYTFGDLKSFKTQYSRVNNTPEEQNFQELKERLKPICKRTLRRQVLEYINYTSRIALVEKFAPMPEEERLYDLVSDYLQSEKLYALPVSQRQLMTLILRRLLASSTFAISGTLQALADKLDGILQQQENPDDAMNQAIAADFEELDEVADEWAEDEDEPAKKAPVIYSEQDIYNIRTEAQQLREFEKLAKEITENSKGKKLLTALHKGFEELERLGAPRKAIIFTESTRTQQYLLRILEASVYAGKVALFNGSNNDPKSRKIYNNWARRYQNTDRVTGSRTADMRAALVDYFRDEATIMIATEAAAEGINLQFCSLVVNYDLPWNPQRIEQRIGRCHRYGQKFDVVVVNFLNEANAADIRVYQLLNEKFNLFNGVFGASDEVLGTIESGVDFEKRIARIYQECRTPEQIETAFNDLQLELDGQISDAIKQTRQQLLENFDEEVNEKLRVNLAESKDYLSKYENWLWGVTRYYLREDADFATHEHSFTLRHNPFPEITIHPGPYRIGKNVANANVYRISHPLAQGIIENCKADDLPIGKLTFNYSSTPVKISILESLLGQSGWVLAKSLSISTFETEDYVLLAGMTNTYLPLDIEICRRLFSLPANVLGTALPPTDNLIQCLETQLNQEKSQVLEEVGIRNAAWFEQELEKLDKWGEDRRNSLRVTLRELDDHIKDLKKQARAAPNLPEKLKLEKERRRLETERDLAWKEYDHAAREIDHSKDELIEKIEQRLQQQSKEEQLFLIHWNII